MALSKRDQKTLTITIVLVLGFVVWVLGIEPVYKQYQELNETVATEKQKFEQNQQTLSEATAIDEGYARVEAQFGGDAEEAEDGSEEELDRDPSEVFNEEVVALVQKQVGQIPEYSPPSTAEIKGASGYEFLILPLTVKTGLEKAAALLREFDEKGYLIQSATLTRDADLSKEDITLELNLGRIVKIAEEEEFEPAGPGSLKLQRGGAR